MPTYTLTKTQQKAVEYTDGPLLIVAGAGTGKTTVITEKIKYLIQEKGAQPEEILALTFTENAAHEMRERVDAELETGYVDLEISTFHAFCQRLLEQYGLEIGIPNHFRLLTQTDAWMLLKDNIYTLGLDYYRPIGSPTQHIHALLNHFSKCKDELISREAYLDYAENVTLDKDAVQTDEKSRLTELANAYHAYNQLLLESTALDFGDLMYYAVKLLEERPAILAALQKQYKYILVDEFQDVNWSQYYLVKLLAEPVIARSEATSQSRRDSNALRACLPAGKARNDSSIQLTVVGDDDQSIYAFRGASVSNIMRFKEDFDGAEEIVLTENYRSGQEILDISYTSVQHNNPDRLEEKLGINKKLKSKIKNLKSKVEHAHLQHVDQEVQAVVEKVAELKKKNNDITWDDIAILVRANNHAKPFMQALDKAGIPYEFFSSQGLYYQPVVADCINFLRLLVDYRNNNALYRMLELSFRALDPHDIQKISYYARRKSISLYHALGDAAVAHVSKPGIAQCEGLRALITAAVADAKTKRPTEVLYDFLEKSGYLEYLTVQESTGNRDAARSIAHLKQFFDLVNQYEQNTGERRVQAFVQYFETILESGEQGQLSQPIDTPDSVNIMTIHGSKGLEFKHVFVVNLAEGRFPSRRRANPIEIPEALIHEVLPEGDAHYQEERRLFYVACTRAKEGLYLYSSDYYSEKRKAKISRFLHELGYTGREFTEKELTTFKKSATKKEVGERVYEVPKTFSISQLHTFARSPYQYKLEYILKIPQRGSHHFSFGNTMHLTLQKFYTEIKTQNSASQPSLFDAPVPEKKEDGITAPSLDHLLELYEQSWIGDWYRDERQRKEYREKGKDMLKVFYKHHDGKWRVPVALEGGFSVRLGDYTVRGKIDRIDMAEDGTLEIIDYKTGKPKTKVSGNDKDQLLLYQIAAETLPQYRNIAATSKLTYYYLTDDSTVSFIGDDKEKEKLKEKLVEIIDKIHATDWAKIGPDDVGYFDKPGK